jgi:hypothetical protein
MSSWRKAIKYYPIANWGLIIALVIQLLLQMQFHLHHDNDASEPHRPGHHHDVDYHYVAGEHAVDQQEHGDIHVLKSMPDTILKKIFENNSLIILAVCLLLLVPLLLKRKRHTWFLPTNEIFRSLYYGLAPPLRAPPLH